MRAFAVAVAAAASLGAAAIHFALGPHHVDELGALGLGFYLAGILQAGFAALLLAGRGTDKRSDRATVAAVIAVNVSILAAWVVSRTVGLPAGAEPWMPEAIGVADSISAALEVLVVASGAMLLRGAGSAIDRPPTRGLHLRPAARFPALALIAVATAVAVLSPEGVAGHGADGHPHGPTNASHETEPHDH